MSEYNRAVAKIAIRKIIPEKIYTKQEIVKFDLIPWAKHNTTVKRILESGSLTTHFIKGKSPANNRWRTVGSDITEYLKEFSGLN